MIPIITACGSALIAAIVSIVTLFLNRKWQKEDRTADRLQELSKNIGDVKKALDAHIAENAEQDALQARRRIIAFSDESGEVRDTRKNTSTTYWMTSRCTNGTVMSIRNSRTVKLNRQHDSSWTSMIRPSATMNSFKGESYEQQDF